MSLMPYLYKIEFCLIFIFVLLTLLLYFTILSKKFIYSQFTVTRLSLQVISLAVLPVLLYNITAILFYILIFFMYSKFGIINFLVYNYITLIEFGAVTIILNTYSLLHYGNNRYSNIPTISEIGIISLVASFLLVLTCYFFYPHIFSPSTIELLLLFSINSFMCFSTIQLISCGIRYFYNLWRITIACYSHKRLLYPEIYKIFYFV